MWCLEHPYQREALCESSQLDSQKDFLEQHGPSSLGKTKNARTLLPSLQAYWL